MVGVYRGLERVWNTVCNAPLRSGSQSRKAKASWAEAAVVALDVVGDTSRPLLPSAFVVQCPCSNEPRQGWGTRREEWRANTQDVRVRKASECRDTNTCSVPGARNRF